MTSPIPMYDPNVPKSAASTIGGDQMNFLNNFMTLYNAFAANHVPLDFSTDMGNHTILQMLDQSLTRQFQTNTGEISLYAKKTTGQTDQIYLRFQGNQTEFPLTNYQLYSLGTPPPNIRFFSMLPGGIIVYFGIATINLSNVNGFPITLLPAVAKRIITINACPIGTTPSYPPNVSLQNPNANGIYDTILLQSPGSPVSPTMIYYFVLGNTV